MQIQRLFVFVFVIMAGMLPGAASSLQVADVFTDHMVLQRQTPIRVGGSAEPGQQVLVGLANDGAATTTVGADGRWQSSCQHEKREDVITSSWRRTTSAWRWRMY